MADNTFIKNYKWLGTKILHCRLIIGSAMGFNTYIWVFQGMGGPSLSTIVLYKIELWFSLIFNANIKIKKTNKISMS